MLARATIETWVIKAEKGDRDCCPKCDGRVFEAEKMVTASVRILKGKQPLLKNVLPLSTQKFLKLGHFQCSGK